MSSRAALRSAPAPSPERAPSSELAPPVRRPGPVQGWLTVTRAQVLPLTLGAGAAGGLLAARSDHYAWPLHLLAVVGLLLAHVCANLLVALSDRSLPTGPDPASPLRSGLVRRRPVGLAVIGLSVAVLGAVVALTVWRGWPVPALVAAAAAVLWGAGRLRSRTGRGPVELAAVVLWGPLMVAGAFVAAVGALPWQVALASVPYGLLCASVLLGGHLDAGPDDAPAGSGTAPVRVAEPGARTLAQLLLVGCYATTGVAVAVGALPWPALLVALALPLLRSAAGTLRRPRPHARGPWAAPVLQRHGLCSGGLLLVGLALAAALDLGVALSGLGGATAP